MQYENVHAVFKPVSNMKDTYESEVGLVRKEQGRWWVYPEGTYEKENDKQHILRYPGIEPSYGFLKRKNAEWWLKHKYAATHEQMGVLYGKDQI